MSEAESLDDAIAECGAALGADMEAQPDLVVSFVSPHHAESWKGLPEAVAECFPGACQLGCSASGVLGGGHEVEGSRALAMTCATLPGVELEPLVFAGDSWADPRRCCPQIEALVREAAGDDEPAFLILPEPFTCPAEPFVAGLDRLFPASVKIGGLASGSSQPAGNLLWVGDRVVRSGAVALAMHGDLEISTIVAQGCRAVGVPMFVTAAEGNVVLELDGVPPVEALQGAYGAASPEERELFRHSLFLGVVMRQGEDEYGPGDFLIRNLVQADPDTGSIAIAAVVHPGDVVQFHLRDADASADDLAAHLAAAGDPEGVAGALLFSCLGRGRGLYGVADHDSRRFHDRYRGVALGGFFCNGEIGPVRGRTFLHGYTSSFGLFRPRSQRSENA